MRISTNRAMGSVFALALICWVTAAYAETTPATTTSEIQTPSMMERISGSFASSLFGPAVTDPASPYQPTKDGRGERDETAAIFTKNVVGASYKLNNTLSIGPNFLFQFTPVLGKGVSLLDPYLKIAKSKLIDTGNFNMNADLRFYAPLTTASQNNGLITSVLSYQTWNYTIADSRFSLGVLTIIGGNIVKKATVTDSKGNTNTLKAMTVYAGPQVSYQVTPLLAATLLAEMGASRNFGTGLTDFYPRTDYTNLAPGLSWDIMPGMNLSPYLNIPIGYRIAADTTTLGMDFSWKFL